MSPSPAAVKARAELFGWSVAGRNYVVQTDLYYTKLRKAWAVSAPVADLVRRAAADPASPLWEAVGRLFEARWLPSRPDYAGANLEFADDHDPAARRLEHQAVAALQPYLVFAEVRDACNLACPFCYVATRLNDHSRGEHLRAAIDRAAEAGAHKIVITGGEPTLGPDLVDHLLHAAGRGLAVVVRSNLFKLPGDIGRLAGHGRIVFITSWHHADEAAFDRMVGRGGAKRRIVEGVRELRRLGVRVAAHVVARRDNFDALPRMVDEFAGLGIPYVLTDHVMTFAGEHGSAAAAPLAEKLSPDQTRDLLGRGLVV
ncbi:MAG TPA: radical SAM protein, partial [Urbifossiella sp.]|nr:radical SAM protein [Urbifossiella sp.]